MYVSRAKLGHLSGEGRWDKQEGTEGSYKVLVLTKMRRRKRVDDYNIEDDDENNHNYEDDDNERQARRDRRFLQSAQVS